MWYVTLQNAKLVFVLILFWHLTKKKLEQESKRLHDDLNITF